MSSTGNPLGSLIIRFIAEAQPFLDGIDGMKSKTNETVNGINQSFGGVNFDSLKEGFGEVAAGVGLATGAVELMKSALEHFAEVEKATIALTALTGSAEGAEASIERLKGIALDNALSFQALVSADQRMVAFGIDAAKIPAVIQAAADAAAATNKDFSSVSDALDRIALSGTAGGRVLATLGLSVQDLGRAMGLSATATSAAISEAFKDLDVSERVDVLTAALDKYAGVAQQTAQGLSGQWQKLKTEVEFALEDLGKALAPLAKDAMSVFGEILADAKDLVDYGIVPLLNAYTKLTEFADSADKKLHTSSQDFSNSTSILNAGIAVMLANLGITADKLDTAAIASGVFGQSMRQNASDLSPLESSFTKLSKAAQTIIDQQADAEAAYKKAKDALAELTAAYNSHTPAANGVLVTTQDLTRAEAEVEKAFKATQSTVNLLPKTFTDALSKFKEFTAEYLAGATDALTYSNAQKEIQKAFDALTPAQQKLLTGFKDMPEAIVGSKAALEAYQAVIKPTAESVSALNNELATQSGDLGALLEPIQQQIESLSSFRDAMQAAGRPTADLQSQIDALTRRLNELKGRWSEQVAAVLALGGAFGAASNDSIQWAKSLDAIEKATGTSTSSTGVAPAMKSLVSLIRDARAEGGQFFPEIQLGIRPLSELEETLRKDGVALDRMTTAFDENGNAIYTHTQRVEAEIQKLRDQIAVNQQTGQSTYELRQKIETLSLSLQNNADKWHAVSRQINEAITSNLTRGLTDIITQTGKVGDAFKSMGESIVSIVLNRIIKDALNPLLSSLDGVIAKLGGLFGGGGGGVLGTSVGAGGIKIPTIGGGADKGGLPGIDGLPGLDLGGGAGSGASGGSSALSGISGLTGILGAVGSIGSLVTGIIGNFQSARQETTLNAIEGNTRYANITLGGDGADDSVKGWLHHITNILRGSEDSLLYTLNTTLGRIEGATESAWAEIVTFHRDFKTTFSVVSKTAAPASVAAISAPVSSELDLTALFDGETKKVTDAIGAAQAAIVAAVSAKTPVSAPALATGRQAEDVSATFGSALVPTSAILAKIADSISALPAIEGLLAAINAGVARAAVAGDSLLASFADGNAALARISDALAVLQSTAISAIKGISVSSPVVNVTPPALTIDLTGLGAQIAGAISASNVRETAFSASLDKLGAVLTSASGVTSVALSAINAGTLRVAVASESLLASIAEFAADFVAFWSDFKQSLSVATGPAIVNVALPAFPIKEDFVQLFTDLEKVIIEGLGKLNLTKAVSVTVPSAVTGPEKVSSLAGLAVSFGELGASVTRGFYEVGSILSGGRADFDIFAAKVLDSIQSIGGVKPSVTIAPVISDTSARADGFSAISSSLRFLASSIGIVEQNTRAISEFRDDFRLFASASPKPTEGAAAARNVYMTNYITNPDPSAVVREIADMLKIQSPAFTF